ncbi:MAG: ABC transporter substrate-binding protein, partial [Oceanospirillales bacterium]|nr:ABC transporter substrate-binding protein [Oceanospirillales bacterium]
MPGKVLWFRYSALKAVLLSVLLPMLVGCDRTAVTPREEMSGSVVSLQTTISDFPVLIRTAHGEAHIERPPKRVVTLGAAAEDWSLQLGVVPVAIEPHYWGGDRAGYLPWFREAVQARGAKLPEVISSYPELDVERLLALQPDLILAPQSGLT